ncbi:MAG TPA: helix-hairpin-helix domain-containing protein, partial [bacterium]|nr:helix-hairpin-helix domain-containing protein [bacterium]
MNLLKEKILVVILAAAIAVNLVYLKNFEGFRKKILSGQDTVSEDSKTSKQKFVEVVYKPLIELSEDEKAYFKESLKLDLNKAVADDLMEISGIGKSTAQKIVKYREDNGKFKTIDELKEVPGIGETKFETFKYYITVSNIEELKSSEAPSVKKIKKKTGSSGDGKETSESEPKSKKKKKKLEPSEKADLNNSDFETLRSVKGIGKAAQRIIDYREENNGFKSV